MFTSSSLLTESRAVCRSSPDFFPLSWTLERTVADRLEVDDVTCLRVEIRD